MRAAHCSAAPASSPCSSPASRSSRTAVHGMSRGGHRARARGAARARAPDVDVDRAPEHRCARMRPPEHARPTAPAGLAAREQRRRPKPALAARRAARRCPPCASATERTIERPSPAPRSSPRAAAALERLEQPRGGVRPGRRAAVVDAQQRLARRARRCGRRRTRRGGCSGRRSRQVLREPLEQPRARRARGGAGSSCRSTSSAARVAPRRGAAPRRRGRPARVRAADGRCGPAAIRPSSRSSMRSTVSTTSAAHRAQLLRAGVRVGERDVDLGADDGQRAAQLVPRVGDEPLARLERAPGGARARAPASAQPRRGGDERAPASASAYCVRELGQRGVRLARRAACARGGGRMQPVRAPAGPRRRRRRRGRRRAR